MKIRRGDIWDFVQFHRNNGNKTIYGESAFLAKYEKDNMEEIEIYMVDDYIYWEGMEE